MRDRSVVAADHDVAMPDAMTRDALGRPLDPMSIAIDPMPERASGAVPWIGAGRSLLADPTEFLTEQRALHGDTFVVDALGYRLFCVFSPTGVEQLYAISEDVASFGIGTFYLLRLKLPDELFFGRRLTPHSLFGAAESGRHLGHLDGAIDAELTGLGDSGDLELFALSKRLAHRMGFASWFADAATLSPVAEMLMGHFDALDAAEAFVRPSQAFRTRRLSYRDEWAAIGAIENIALGLWDRGEVTDADLLSRSAAAFAEAEPDITVDQARRQAARDAMVIHLGSQTNLFAALGWTLVDLLGRPELLDAVRDGDSALLDRCASESIRMAQRSITLRYVLRQCEVDGHRLSPGTFITTMLPVLNTSAAPTLDTFDPDHYEGRKLTVPLTAKELVSTFGHGIHSCPAARFSIAAIRQAVTALIDRFDLTPQFDAIGPRRRQMGGVARADRPATVTYRSR